MWAGTAAAAHLTAHGSWEASYREMHEALVAMRAAARHGRVQLHRGRPCQHGDVERGAVMLVDSDRHRRASSTLRTRQPERGAGARHLADRLAGRAVRWPATPPSPAEFAAAYDEAAAGCAGRGRRPGRRVHHLRPAHRGEPGQPRPRREPLAHLRPHRLHRQLRAWRATSSVLSCSLPSSLGGDLSGLPSWAAWILDQVEGFVWPDADSERLRGPPPPGATRRSRSPISRPTAPRPSAPSRSSTPPRCRSPSR